MNITVPFLEKRFDYDEQDMGRTVRCRNCNAPMKLVRAGEEELEEAAKEYEFQNSVGKGRLFATVPQQEHEFYE